MHFFYKLLDKVTNYIENQLSGLEKDVNAESEELGNVIDSKLEQFDDKIEKRLSKIEGSIAKIIVALNV